MLSHWGSPSLEQLLRAVQTAGSDHLPSHPARMAVRSGASNQAIARFALCTHGPLAVAKRLELPTNGICVHTNSQILPPLQYPIPSARPDEPAAC